VVHTLLTKQCKN